MYKRDCILALTQGARFRAAQHMRFDSLNDVRSYTGPQCDASLTRFRYAHRLSRLSSFQTICGSLLSASKSKRTKWLRKSDDARAERRLAAGISEARAAAETDAITAAATLLQVWEASRARLPSWRAETGELLATCHCHAFATYCLTCQPCPLSPLGRAVRCSPSAVLGEDDDSNTTCDL